MSRENLRVERDNLDPNSGANYLIIEVYDILLRQPGHIGPSADRCKPLDLTNPNHRETFLLSVHSEIENLKTTRGFQYHTGIDDALRDAWRIIRM